MQNAVHVEKSSFTIGPTETMLNGVERNSCISNATYAQRTMHTKETSLGI